MEKKGREREEGYYQQYGQVGLGPLVLMGPEDVHLNGLPTWR